jgi:hypothetical protein
MKSITSTEYFSNISIPDDWDSLEEFVQWYLDARMPMMIPWNATVIKSDDAAAICVFKKGQYQVEFYLEFPRMYVPKHSHPDMEVIIMDLGGGKRAPTHQQHNGTDKIWGNIRSKLMPGEYHGGDESSKQSNGFVTLAFQKWYNTEKMTSAAIQWEGETAGPVQETLIKQHNPNAVTDEGYADISRNNFNKD